VLKHNRKISRRNLTTPAEFARRG